MKKLSILALVLAFVMMFSVVSFAADSFKVTDATKIPTGTTVTPAATDIAVTTGTADGNYYGILLVEGNALPTADNAILYIDQLTGDGNAASVAVKPIMPKVGTELTLYISSNVAGAELIKIPMIYSADAPVEPEYLIAEIDGDGEQAGLGDALEILSYVNLMTSKIDEMTEEQMFAVAEIDGDGEAAGLGDALEILSYVNLMTSKLDDLLY